MKRIVRSLMTVLLLTGVMGFNADLQAAPDAVKITVLYDAFGKASKMTKDWGFSA